MRSFFIHHVDDDILNRETIEINLFFLLHNLDFVRVVAISFFNLVKDCIVQLNRGETIIAA